MINMQKEWCKVIMYHYVRDSSENMPNLKYLNTKDFIKQLNFFKKKYWFISKKNWLEFVKNWKKIPNGVLLTFDDGLIDHYINVLPILEERWLWWIFFVNSLQLENNNILNVHKIHYLLSKYNSKEVYDKFIKILKNQKLINKLDDISNFNAYVSQNLDRYSLIIKKINYCFSKIEQTKMLDRLLLEFNEKKKNIWWNLYMNKIQILEIEKAWNIIWFHWKSHFLLSKVKINNMKYEIDIPIVKLTNFLWLNIDCFCYPFWWKDSYNEKIINNLSNIWIKYSFCVEERDIEVEDIKWNKYKLPRYDCLSFNQ
jgi:hypothetical protein